MRILLTGAAGMLGHDVRSAIGRAGHEAIPLTRSDLDVTDADAVKQVFTRERPDAVISCTAWTDVDGAESQEAAAAVLNRDAAGYQAAAAATNDAFFVTVSTDYVFDGKATSPYLESAPTAPVSAYGRTKLLGEQAVAAAAPDGHAIVRTAWLFGVNGGNFVATMLRLAGERDQLTVVDDQIGCPTYTGHLADALVTIAADRVAGIRHVAGGGQCSWYDLAAATFQQTGTEIELLRGDSANLDRPAPRPAYSVLRSQYADTPTLAPWRQGLADYLGEN